MKTTILLALVLMISISGFSQKLNDMTFVPRGSFSVQNAETIATISVENFRMSNEITNKEFREFYNQIKSAPNDSISWIDISSIKNGTMGKPKIISKAYSDIIDRLIDVPAWKSVFSKDDYFTNQKYDNYPVVGVTWEGANYYCMWRTKEENKKLKGQSKALQMDYRLPTQYEWEYALTFNDTESNVGLKELRQVNKGDKNKIGLINLNGNVAEWTSTSDSKNNTEYKVVKGSSWKSDSKDTQTQIVLPDKGTDYIGFRIVQSDMGKQ
jgi:formylglycine-generating enzyme required for sulfatase activity